ncbi:MAG TPA: relaxase/mobilization nuclease domain-containing protein, partial [Puia sp.]|nr:relaxase/mobilization nuclease domain-containing protein [Puia sp.]
MRAKIDMYQGMNYLVNYNEEKITNHEAECLYAGNFLKDATDLSLKEKKARFADLIELNPQTIRPATTLVAEFAPGERLPASDLIDIARDLMEGVGFGGQPYLVYRHDDTHHLHIHIISTKITSSGDLIPESFIGATKLQPTARLLEKKYNLALESPDGQPRHNPREKIQYGKTATWQAVSDTLRYVLENYRYRSVPELNAALRLYNLTVKGGAPGTRLHEHGGLIYQVLDEQGKPRNHPMKASKLPFKPTLKNLEPKFAANNTLSADEISYTRHTLEDILNKKPATTERFLDQLRRNRLAAVPAYSPKGEITNLYFIDLSSKTVLPAADLGSSYTAPAIQKQLGFDPFLTPSQQKTQSHQHT